MRQLISRVIKQIKLDVEFEDNDLSALEILLSSVSKEYLEAYLPDDFEDDLEFRVDQPPLEFKEENRDE